MSRGVAPPSGAAPPARATLAGREVALVPLAEAVAERYFAEFPEDLDRYGEAAWAWELHDTQYCLQWAILDVGESADLKREIAWLANVLRARGFPLEHLARNLELAADVAEERLGEPGSAVAERLRTGTALVRAV